MTDHLSCMLLPSNVILYQLHKYLSGDKEINMRQYEKWQKNIDDHQHYTVVALAAIGMFLLLDAILSGFILPSWLLQLQAMPKVSMSWSLYEAFLSFFALNLAIV